MGSYETSFHGHFGNLFHHMVPTTAARSIINRRSFQYFQGEICLHRGKAAAGKRWESPLMSKSTPSPRVPLAFAQKDPEKCD